MSQAIFGLVGVLLGGFIAAGTKWLELRAARRRSLAMAARLVASEFGDALAAVAFAREHKRWWPNELSVDAWTTHSPVLAAELTLKEWLVVLKAHDTVQTLVRTREAFGGGLAPIGAAVVADLDDAGRRLNEGVDWLAARSYTFPWWKGHRHVGLYVARRALHRDGPDVPT